MEELRSDSDWRAGYRESVRLCARAWGWNVDAAARVPDEERNSEMGWTNWDVRLAKIIRSLWIFEVSRIRGHSAVNTTDTHKKQSGYV